MSQPNTSPIFPDSVLLGQTALSAANTDRTGATGTLYTVATGAVKGTRVDRVQVIATGTTTQGKIRVFKTDAGGINPRLYAEADVTAITPSASITTFSVDLVRTDGLPYCTLVSGQLLRLTTHNAEAFHANAEGGDF